MIWGIVALIFIVLVIATPGVAVLLTLVGFFVALFALIKGNLRWARITNRKGAAVAAGAMVFGFFAAGIGLGSSVEANAVTVASSDAAVAETKLAGSLGDYLGRPCESEDLYMQQGDVKAYCYPRDSEEGLVWVDSDEHVALVAEAKERAEEERKAAAEEAAAASQAAEESRKAAEASRAAEEERAAEAAEASRQAEEARVAEEARAAEEARVAEEARQAQERAESERAAEAARAEREAAQKTQAPANPPAGGSTFYKNCDAVRAAGAAPIRVGEPGYARKLDRDGDGIGCE